MNERKNIDRLFQEKFKDFEAKPVDEVWGNIEAQLDGRKRRRIIPIWWKLSGVAAIFLLGFLISKSIYSSDIKAENSVVEKRTFNKSEKGNPNTVNKNESKSRSGVPVQIPIISETELNKTEHQNSEGVQKQNGSEARTLNSEKGKSFVVTAEKNSRKTTNYSSKSSIAGRKSSDEYIRKNKSTGKDNFPINQSTSKKFQNQITQNTKITENPIVEKQIVHSDFREKSIDKAPISAEKENISLDDLKRNDNSKIATTEIEKKVNDTTLKGSVANNVLEELLNEKESKSKQESKRNRWQLNSNVAPVFLGSISNGSPIDSTLAKNSKSFNTNVGFGIGVSYAVTKKLSVRTGLNKVNMSYNTNDILFFTGIQTKTLKNLKPTASSAMIHVQSIVLTSPALPSETELLPFENAIVNKNSGYLTQEMGYLEMPVEMTYNLVDKKFGIQIIGGFSTLFLQDNSIRIISADRNTLLGEAKNLNDVHFSSNLGLGVKYSFFKSFELSVEPTVKYQLNTFRSDAGNFKPYLFGIYSGVSYKF